MKTRNGKIAQLPRDIRQQLNERLECSEPGPKLLEWLNALPEVKQVVTEEFEGEPISSQNLSQWRQGGFQEWLIHEDLWEAVHGIDDFTVEMPPDNAVEFVDRLPMVVAARYARLLTSWDGKYDKGFEASARILNGLCGMVVRLQKQMHWARRDRQDAELRLEKEEEARSEKRREKLLAPIFDSLKVDELTGMFGSGPAAKKLARYVLAVQAGRMDSRDANPLPNRTDGRARKRVKKGRELKSKPLPKKKTKETRRPHKPSRKSKPIKVNQTHPQTEIRKAAGLSAKASRNKSNQGSTESHPTKMGGELQPIKVNHTKSQTDAGKAEAGPSAIHGDGSVPTQSNEGSTESRAPKERVLPSSPADISLFAEAEE